VSTDVKSRRVLQGLETRDALLAAARQLFGTQGYLATSTEEIVAKAGVTKGALYHHFSDKEQLFRAVFEQIQREISDKSVVEFLQADKFEPLVLGCQLWVDSHCDPIIRQIVLVDARGVLGTEVTRQIETRMSTVALRGALRVAMNAGVIERRPLRPLAFMLIGALTEACLYVAEAEDAEQGRADVNQLIVDLLTGLRAA
jgi:AcrR family transcriptional regulator